LVTAVSQVAGAKQTLLSVHVLTQTPPTSQTA
jgi:hypothetical protein